LNEIKIKHELKIHEPEITGAYGISVADWDYLKNKIRQIKDESSVLMVVWSAFLGAFISSLIYSLTSDFPKTPVGSIPIREAISWSATILCFAISIICLIFWKKSNKTQIAKASSVVEQMEIIEARYKSTSSVEQRDEKIESKGETIIEENFQNFDGWERYLDGEISLTDEVAPITGNHCLKKDSKNDPHGGFKTVGYFGLGFVFSGWIFRPSSKKGGKGDRIAIEDNSFNGYGFSIAHGSKFLVIERRDSGIPTEISGRVPFNAPKDAWYNFNFHSTPDGKFAIHINDKNGNRLSAITAVDSKYNNFDRIVIHGGHPYYVDGLKIVATS